MTEPATASSHELFVWNANELLAEVKKTRGFVARAIEANEFLKSHADADIVALTQLIQASNKIATQIRLLGVMGRAYIKEIKGTKYIIFKGNPYLRPNLNGTRYRAENAKVRCFVVGSKDIIEDAAKGTKVAVIAFVAIDIAMEATSDHFSLASLGVRVASDVLQAVISAGIGVTAGVVMTTLIGAPVVITFVTVIVAGFVVGMILTDMDKQFGLTEKARLRMMAFEKQLISGANVIRKELVAETSALGEAGREAAEDIRAGAYRVDRFFSSAYDMLREDGKKQILWVFG